MYHTRCGALRAARLPAPAPALRLLLVGVFGGQFKVRVSHQLRERLLQLRLQAGDLLEEPLLLQLLLERLRLVRELREVRLKLQRPGRTTL